ncbi:MAG TPA: YetF domain-containing protein [Flavisolibacter sp.]|jgi:uncharacterized membrane protein YcaP (DUF421 family)
MKTEEIKLGDWARILFGEMPPGFFIEVVIRTLIIFLLLIISMRVFGKRMAAQITRMELVALFSLAAAIGVPLQSPDRGLLPSFIIAIVVVGVGRIVAWLAFKNQKFEARVKDKLSILINDGIIDMKKIRGTSLTTERVFATLRSDSIRHLGEVKRLYFQSNGTFSLVKDTHPSPGLCILPTHDKAFCDEQTQTQDLVCKTCGNRRKQNNGSQVCTNCGEDGWVTAVF